MISISTRIDAQVIVIAWNSHSGKAELATAATWPLYDIHLYCLKDSIWMYVLYVFIIRGMERNIVYRYGYELCLYSMVPYSVHTYSRTVIHSARSVLQVVLYTVGTGALRERLSLLLFQWARGSLVCGSSYLVPVWYGSYLTLWIRNAQVGSDS